MQQITTLKLSKEEVEEIILNHLIQSGIPIEGGLTFDVGTRFEGHGLGERQVQYFEGISFQSKVGLLQLLNNKDKKDKGIPKYNPRFEKDDFTSHARGEG